MSDELLQNFEGFAHFDKCLNTAVELLGGVRSRELYADSRLTLWHYWIVEAGYINALFLQCRSELLAQTSVVQHHRTDSRLGWLDIKARGLHLGDEVLGVGMQAVLQLVAASQYLEGLQSRRSNQRRNRVGEQVWTAALAKQVNDLLLTCGEATY